MYMKIRIKIMLSIIMILLLAVIVETAPFLDVPILYAGITALIVFSIIIIWIIFEIILY